MGPSITVRPGGVDFGDVDALASSPATLTLSIENSGEGALRIHDIMFSEDSDPVFSAGSVSSVLVLPGVPASLVVEFDPYEDGYFSGDLNFVTDDPVRPVLDVSVTGRGRAPRLETSVDEVDFGSVLVGCTPGTTVRFANVGSVDLEVSEIFLVAATSELEFSLADGLDGELAPGDSIEGWLRYSPVDDHLDDGSIVALTNDPLAPSVVLLVAGVGVYSGLGDDVFVQPLDDEITSFELAAIPVVETIVVAVNGVELMSGWRYNSVDNTVDFDDDAIPGGGAEIEVTYVHAGPCD